MTASTGCQMARRLPSATNASDALSHYSNLQIIPLRCQPFMRWYTSQSWNATSMSGKISTIMWFWVEARQCSQAWLKEFRRNSRPWYHQGQKLMWWVRQRGSSCHGLEGQSCHHWVLSKRCGLPRPSIRSKEPQSSTRNASDTTIYTHALLK